MSEGLAQAVLLGALHGATTFMPVSRGGHWALSEMLFDLDAIGPTDEAGLVLASLVATVFIVHNAAFNLVRASARAMVRPTSLATTDEGRDLVTVVLAQIPTAVAWLLLRESGNALNRQPLFVALGLLFTASVLLSTAWAGHGGQLHPTLGHALLIGAGQGFALFPGISRSGCTIAVALWLGLTERRSFELSLLVSIPAIIGSLAIDHAGAFMSIHRAGGVFTDVSLIRPLATTAVALVVGIGAAKLVRTAVVRGHVAWFAMWVAPLAIATFAFARAWPTH
jgi:undecaprenyl-diphosphatase